MKSSRGCRALERGLTLIEILVVCAIIAILTVAVVSGSGTLPSARLKRSSALIASAVKVAYTRATSTSKNLRIVFDLDQNSIWLEEGDSPMLVQSKDKTGTGGADPLTEQERAAYAEGERVLRGPPVPKPRFHAVAALGFGEQEGTVKGAKPLQRGIKFRSVQSLHDDDARTSGRAYLYFWPGGSTERSNIEIRIGDSAQDSHILTLIVSPLTGKVKIKPGAVDFVKPFDEQTDGDKSERQDNGW